jgi:ABC-type phosphate/phosphonate transport system substrate-binding protein
MKTLRILVGLAACCLWSGCAHDHSEAASKTGTEPTNAAMVGQTVTFGVVASTNGAPLTYQWYFNGTNATGATNR